ncbi:MAG: hypothetical protein J6O55_05555 [Lachnospiraceae bacterium]|nr:hypothetical protein [Lachnospiraceae bacterium]
MKIIHCSDIHLDAAMGSYLSQEKAEERRNELLLTFVRMVRYAAKNQAEAVLIVGNLFDGEHISQATLSIVEQCISGNPHISFFYASAYMDQDPFIRAMYGKYPNLIFFLEERTYRLKGNIVISAPFSPDELVLDPSDVNIVLYHGMIQPAHWRGRNIDYLALGYYHELQEGSLGIRGRYCYSGCLEGRDFEETGDKGFVRLDIEGGVLDPVFIKAAKRGFHIIPIDISNLQGPEELDRCIATALTEKSIPNSDFVRIQLIGGNTRADLQLPYLEQRYAGHFYFFQIVPTHAEADINNSFPAYDISLRGEFIRLVTESSLPESQKTMVIRTGIAALEGRSITEGNL